MKLDSRSTLEFELEELHRQIQGSLCMLEGFVYKSPSQGGYHFSRRVNGKMLTRYVRKRLVAQAQAMVQNRHRLDQLLDRLSELNWRLLQLRLPDAPEELQELD